MRRSRLCSTLPSTPDKGTVILVNKAKRWAIPVICEETRVAAATSGYDTLDADALTKVLEFLPLDDVAAESIRP